MSDEAGPELDVFAQRFRDRCRNDLRDLAALSVECDASPGAAARETMIALSHRIAGSAGIFGYPELSTDAFALESLLIGETPAPPADIRAALLRLIAALEEVVEHQTGTA